MQPNRHGLHLFISAAHLRANKQLAPDGLIAMQATRQHEDVIFFLHFVELYQTHVY